MPKELAHPEPTALVWARTASGLDPDEVARKLKLGREKLLKWESGEQLPSFPQLRKLASLYKRPMAAFYLESLPALPKELVDFRRGARSDRKPQSAELTFEIRKARDRRDWLTDLRTELGNPVPKFDVPISLSTDPDKASDLIREKLRVSLLDQSSWSSDYEAFSGWRDKLERAGLACFQAPNLSVAECRGFSVSDGQVPIIVTNIKEAPRGRLFTLIHELAHISLHIDGLCDLKDGTAIETYCNRVAGATIYPKEAFLQSSVVRNHPRGTNTWSQIELQNLSRTFGGSREAALVRLLSLGLTDQNFYDTKREDFRKEYENLQPSKGFVPPHIVELSCAGGLFTSAVLESLERNNITLADASTYLHIGFKHLAEADRTAARFQGGLISE